MTRYLWHHRTRPPLGSLEFFRTWAKRILTMPTLFKTAFHRWRLIRRGASIADDSCIGEVKLTGRLSRLLVGASSFVGRAEIMLHDTVTIGAHVCVNDGVLILTASHDLRDPSWVQVAKPVVIGDYAWIASRAVILPGVHIGRGAVVGAGAVVSRDVPPLALAVGNPAIIREDRRIGEFNYHPVHFLAFQQAWLGGKGADRR
jgi:acetyltransferase-like isoleucine patch superfamily enzyme